MFRIQRWESAGRHCAVSDDLNNLKERLSRLRHNRPVLQAPVPCYGKRCAVHHPVTIGQVQELQLFDVAVLHPVPYRRLSQVDKLMLNSAYGKVTS